MVESKGNRSGLVFGSKGTGHHEGGNGLGVIVDVWFKKYIRRQKGSSPEHQSNMSRRPQAITTQGEGYGTQRSKGRCHMREQGSGARIQDDTTTVKTTTTMQHQIAGGSGGG